MTWKKNAPKEMLSHEMLVIGCNVINEDQDSSPDLATVETALDEKRTSETKEASEKLQQGLLKDSFNDAEFKVVKATVRRVSTKRKTRVGTADEVVFADNSSDESDGEDVIIL